MAIFLSSSVLPLQHHQYAEKILSLHHLRMSDPSNFCGEPLDVGLFPVEHIFRDEQRKGAVLYTHLLDLDVEPFLNLLPYEV